MVLRIAGHLHHVAGGPGVTAAGEVVLIDEGFIAPTLHHPYMEEVISETKEHHVDRHVEVSGAGLSALRRARTRGGGLLGHGASCILDDSDVPTQR